jgi:hypothetical protein
MAASRRVVPAGGFGAVRRDDPLLQLPGVEIVKPPRDAEPGDVHPDYTAAVERAGELDRHDPADDDAAAAVTVDDAGEPVTPDDQPADGATAAVTPSEDAQP